MIKVLINNQEQQLAEPLSLGQLLNMDNIVHASRFAVAVNENFIPRTQYTDVLIQDGDRIEILTPMQGG